MYKLLAQRTPDGQYSNKLKQILELGRKVETPQEVPAITCFGTIPPSIYEVSNGAPLITERKITFWKKAVGEIIGFINGARTLEKLESYGCNFWDRWATPKKCEKIGVQIGDLGPGSYGAAFHDFPMPDGSTFNQIAHAIEQLSNKDLRQRRTICVNPWIPFYNGWGGLQKAVVSPCHGWLHFRVFPGEGCDELEMRMDQRSADFPIGVPSNMIQYFALLLMIAQVCHLKPKRFIHSFSDAHIYEDQIPFVRTMVGRPPLKLPVLLIDKEVGRIQDFRVHHFEIAEYYSHPAIPNIPAAI